MADLVGPALPRTGLCLNPTVPVMKNGGLQEFRLWDKHATPTSEPLLDFVAVTSWPQGRTIAMIAMGVWAVFYGPSSLQRA